MLQKPATAANWCLEAHLMRELSLGQGEASLEVLPQHCTISMTLDRCQDLSVNCCLVCLPLLRGFVSLLLRLKDVSLLLGLLSLYPGKVLVVDVLRHRDLGDVKLCGGGHQVPLVHPPERAAIELVRSSDEEQSGAELFQHDDTLALVHSGQDDGNSSSGERSPHFPDVVGEEVLGGAGGSSVHSWDVVGQLLGADHASSSILGSTNLLLNKDSGLLGGSLLVHLLGELVDCLLVVHAALAEPVNSTFESIVPGLARVLVLGHCFSCRSESSNKSLVVLDLLVVHA